MALQVAPLPGLDDFVARGDIEQKFIFCGTDKNILLDWLEVYALRDPQFYRSPVLSLYYDTPALDFYHEARNGDYLKTKVRLRWYQDEFVSADQPIDCFFEIKRKCGALRHKQRRSLTLTAAQLSGDLFSAAPVADLPSALGGLGGLNRGILVPILVVDYQRCRFIDAASGARIALDTAIGCRRVNADYLCGAPPIESTFGVLEIKARAAELPALFWPLRRHLRRQSFSKYALCCQRLLDPLGRRMR